MWLFTALQPQFFLYLEPVWGFPSPIFYSIWFSILALCSSCLLAFPSTVYITEMLASQSTACCTFPLLHTLPCSQLVSRPLSPTPSSFFFVANCTVTSIFGSLCMVFALIGFGLISSKKQSPSQEEIFWKSHYGGWIVRTNYNERNGVGQHMRNGRVHGCTQKEEGKEAALEWVRPLFFSYPVLPPLTGSSCQRRRDPSCLTPMSTCKASARNASNWTWDLQHEKDVLCHWVTALWMAVAKRRVDHKENVCFTFKSLVFTGSNQYLRSIIPNCSLLFQGRPNANLCHLVLCWKLVLFVL